MAQPMFGRLWADSAEILGGKQTMVGLRMIQISGMGSSGSRVAKNADFLHFWPRLPGLIVGQQGLVHFGQYLSLRTDSGPAARSRRT